MVLDRDERFSLFLPGQNVESSRLALAFFFFEELQLQAGRFAQPIEIDGQLGSEVLVFPAPNGIYAQWFERDRLWLVFGQFESSCQRE